MSLHACENCRYFVPRGQIRCLIPNTERILDARAGNRCNSFDFQETTTGAKTEGAASMNGQSNPQSAREVWESFFK